jgi:glycosyltransferase involved in cell wall biosynthesis
MITGRVDWMKGLPSQLTAAALVQRRRGVRVLISWTDSPERQAGLREHAGACGLKYESLPYGSFDEWYRRLREQVSIVLQPSMSDSFNIVSIEAAGHGRPFVGSPTIPHTPPAWLVTDPNNPQEIAAVTERILDNYPAASAMARQLADEVLERNNKAYSEIIGRLLNGR